MMARPFSAVAACAALCCLSVLPAPGRSATLEGLILEDHTGARLASARVRIRAAGGEVVADRDTDSAGRFETPPLDAGLYRVEVSKRNYLGARLLVTLPADPVRIRLARLGVISGRVLDADRKPIPHAFISLLTKSADNDAEQWRPLRTIDTNSAGEYRLHGLRPGRYAVGMSLSSYQYRPGAGAFLFPSSAAPTVFEIAGGEEYRDVDFALSPAPVYRVSGRVEGADGETSYAVGLTSRDQPGLGASVTETDDEGRFVLDEVPAGAYHLFAAGPVRGHSWRGATVADEPLFGRSTLDVGGQDISDLALSVQPPRTAVLRLELETPEAARSCPTRVAVRLEALEAWGAEIGRNLDLHLGVAQRVDRLAPTRYRVVAAKLPPGCFQGEVTVVDVEREDREAVVRLTAAARIEGRLVGAEAPQDFQVALVPDDPAASEETLRVVAPQPSGEFVFDGLRPGVYRILSRHRDADPRARWIAKADDAFQIEAFGATVTQIDLPAAPAR